MSIRTSVFINHQRNPEVIIGEGWVIAVMPIIHDIPRHHPLGHLLLGSFMLYSTRWWQEGVLAWESVVDVTLSVFQVWQIVVPYHMGYVIASHWSHGQHHLCQTLHYSTHSRNGLLGSVDLMRWITGFFPISQQNLHTMGICLVIVHSFPSSLSIVLPMRLTNAPHLLEHSPFCWWLAESLQHITNHYTTSSSALLCLLGTSFCHVGIDISDLKGTQSDSESTELAEMSDSAKTLLFIHFLYFYFICGLVLFYFHDDRHVLLSS